MFCTERGTFTLLMSFCSAVTRTHTHTRRTHCTQTLPVHKPHERTPKPTRHCVHSQRFAHVHTPRTHTHRRNVLWNFPTTEKYWLGFKVGYN